MNLPKMSKQRFIGLSASLLLLFFGTSLKAQDVYINPQDSSFRAPFEKIEFGERFSVLAISDANNNYYIADFTQLPSRFEKVWFMEQIFKDDQVVNIDGDLEHRHIWFMAKKGVAADVVEEYFSALKKKCLEKSSQWTEAEKTEWMKKNNKYK